MGYIYKIINKVDKKIYIGQTTQILEDRWKQHRKIGSNCRYLKRAFNKYGINNFEFKLICICFDKDLDNYENQYMEKYNSMVPNGYNLKKGGNNGKHHEETKKKISESLKGRTDIINAKNHLGIPHTEETKNKISDKLKGRKDIIRYSYYGNKNINQYDLNNNFIKSFNNIISASTYNNICRNGISKCCNNKQKTAGGFIWKMESI